MNMLASLRPITIAFACDDIYALHVAVVMQSIFANASPEDSHEFHILTMKLLPETESRMRIVVANGGGTITIHRISEERLSQFPEQRQTLNAYLRLFLPELLPEHSKVLYLGADLFVCPSIWDDPLPTVNAEAMASGLPIVAFAKGGIPEIVGDAGVLVYETSPLALAKSIHDVLSSEVLRERLSQNGIKRASEQFDWKIISQKWLDKLQELLHSG